MAEIEPKRAHITAQSVPTMSSTTASEEESAAARYSQMKHKELTLEDYFQGPADVMRHSKLPAFMRMHGSVIPKMIVPLLFLAGWSTAITCIHKFVHGLGVNSVLLTITGFVVGLALSFRSSTAYERYSDGRKYWAQLLLTSRNMARLIWVHVAERQDKGDDVAKADLLAKLSALQLINAFAVSVKHRLRFEPAVDYDDLRPLLSNFSTLAGDADQTGLKPKPLSWWKGAGMYLGIPMSESNPRKLIKRSKQNLGNTPLEILTYIAGYVEACIQGGQLVNGPNQAQAMGLLATFTDVLTGMERVVNTPLPVAYSISISQITWAYVLALPFQLVLPLGWITIPGTLVGGYIILGLAQIGRELENPFGHDVNDLPLDTYCHELAGDIDALTSRPAPGPDSAAWMKQAGAKVLHPFRADEYQVWESRSVADIRDALRDKAASMDVKLQRYNTMKASRS